MQNIPDWYKKGLLSDDDLKEFVKAKTITPEHFKEITGKTYIE